MADELDTLAAEAAAIEAADPIAQPDGTMAPPAPPADPAAEWREAAHMGCGLVLSLYPELKAEWTADKLDNLGNALARCAERYGWDLADLLGHPLLHLAFATWPLAVPLVKLGKAKAAERAKQQPQPAAPAGQVEARPGVTQPA